MVRRQLTERGQNILSLDRGANEGFGRRNEPVIASTRSRSLPFRSSLKTITFLACARIRDALEDALRTNSNHGLAEAPRELGKCHVGPLLGVLHHVLSLVAAAHDPVGEIECRRHVREHKLFKQGLGHHLLSS
jgi:hypothetical protein